MSKNARLSTKIKKIYKEHEMAVSPLMTGILSECDRIQEIQDRLWEIASTQPLITEYTNKAGASNLTASAALKELRSWELVFQGTCRSIFKVLKDDFTDIDEFDDGLAEYE
jgi:hypothetical protein